MLAADAAGHEGLPALYRHHHGWLHRLLHRRLGNSFDAADLAQDAFVRLLVRPTSFDSFDGARRYLRTVASGLCTDLWRRRAIEQAWLDTLASQPEAFAPSAEHRASVIEALCEIDDVLRSLPVRASEAFVLAVAFDLTDREVAARVGVSDRMVRKYVAQALLLCSARRTACPT